MFKSKPLLMLITGVVLALVLWGVVQAVQNSASRAAPTTPNVDSEAAIPEPVSGQYANAPASILSARQDDTKIFLTGTGVPGAGISLRTNSRELIRTKVSGEGAWALGFTHSLTGQPIAYDLLMVTPDGHQIRSDQSLIVVTNPHIPETTVEALTMGKTLLLLTAPGAHSRVLQTAYTELPGKEGFLLETIDYDNSGGVIFSGSSKQAGKVRIYAGDNLVGESHVDNMGRWSLIFGNIMPLGKYNISAELVLENGNTVLLTLPFARMKPLFEVENSPKILAEYLEDRIQIGRALFGGGYQYTVIYAPIALEE